MARRKEQDTSIWGAVFGALGVVAEAIQALSGVSSKVKVSGHYRNNGRGGKTWVEGHERDYPL